jgi:[ribosomal protein S5]-alanine N-acetyltransferase
MADVIFLKGERIHLRALEEKDLNDYYLQWLNDEDVCRYNSHAVFPNTESKMRSYFVSLQNQEKNIVLAIIHTDTSKHIGNVSLQNINWISRNAEFAILLGDKDFWGDAYGEESAKLIVGYGFERLNLHRIYCGTLVGNKGMMKLAQKLNMSEEGRRRQAIFKHGEYIDIIEYGVLNTEFFSS